MDYDTEGCNTRMCDITRHMYAEKILSDLEEHEGISVSGRNLNNLRYADDTTLLADSNSKWQRLLDVSSSGAGKWKERVKGEYKENL